MDKLFSSLFKVWIYDTALGSSTSKPDLLISTGRAKCRSVDTASRGKEVVVFGGTGVGSLDKTQVYNVNADTWTDGKYFV